MNSMISTKIFTKQDKPENSEKKEIINFLFEHLENYGDPKNNIEKAINYALEESPSFGGFVLASYFEKELAGIVVVNRTGMKGYIPDNILVYIATHKNLRGKGLGKELMEKAIQNAEGDIALHVEKDNPAKFLYEKYGFTNPYLEMRLKRN